MLGSSPAQGSMLGTADVDVESGEQKTASASLNFVAPAEPGEYVLRVELCSLAVIGVELNAHCSFTVVSSDDAALAQDDDDDDDDYE